MNDSAWQISALVAIVAGLLICFWGYRLLKLSLGVIGFLAGAWGGFEAGAALLPASNMVLLVCAAIGGVIGMILCIWLYFLGVFLIGAAAGTVIAAAFHNGTGQAYPLLFLVLPVVFGLVALVAQKVMVSVCTGFSGAYLITAGVWPFVGHGQDAPNVWLYSLKTHEPIGTHGYAALALWVLLALAGIACQLRRGGRPVEPGAQEARA